MTVRRRFRRRSRRHAHRFRRYRSGRKTRARARCSRRQAGMAKFRFPRRLDAAHEGLDGRPFFRRAARRRAPPTSTSSRMCLAADAIQALCPDPWFSPVSRLSLPVQIRRARSARYISSARQRPEDPSTAQFSRCERGPAGPPRHRHRLGPAEHGLHVVASADTDFPRQHRGFRHRAILA